MKAVKIILFYIFYIQQIHESTSPNVTSKYIEQNGITDNLVHHTFDRSIESMHFSYSCK